MEGGPGVGLERRGGRTRERAFAEEFDQWVPEEEGGGAHGLVVAELLVEVRVRRWTERRR